MLLKESVDFEHVNGFLAHQRPTFIRIVAVVIVVLA